ncbi:MAG: hypothetical protein KatS3mg111_4044 [Pirellulaceae bacterium]|nr:MAG: hypothetical protein KatS3mg111_4044 [Pirellulaceae bacterium]
MASTKEKLEHLEEKLIELEHEAAEHLKEAVTGEDEPMEEVAPRASWAMIWFAYPIGLIVFALIAAAVAGWYLAR